MDTDRHYKYRPFVAWKKAVLQVFLFPLVTAVGAVGILTSFTDGL
jgi:hypothetical protein